MSRIRFGADEMRRYLNVYWRQQHMRGGAYAANVTPVYWRVTRARAAAADYIAFRLCYR